MIISGDLHHLIKTEFLTPPYPKQSSKIYLWGLKQIVVMSWIRFFISKIHKRSFRTRIRHNTELNVLFLNICRYLGMERSVMYFWYQKTCWARREDLFNYNIHDDSFWQWRNQKVIYVLNDVKLPETTFSLKTMPSWGF